MPGVAAPAPPATASDSLLGFAQDAGDAGVGVLDVVDRVVVRLAAGELEVEVDRGVVTAPEHEPARRVDADVVEQLVEGDEVAAALRHLRPLAAFDDVDEAHDQRLEALRVGAEGLDRGAHAGHVAMVVGAEDVDQPAEAALELVPVVGDVGGEVGRFAVGPDQHPVLVVAEGRRAQPEGLVAAVGVAGLVELGEGRLDLAAAVEVALGEPGVEADAEAVEGAAHVLEDQLDAAAADRLEIVRSDPLAGDLLAQPDHVVAAVAVLGRLLAAHAGGDRGGEAFDLATGVVDVELALHLVPRRLQQADQGVAVGGVAAAADVQRPGRVGGDELDQDALGRIGRRRSEPLAGAARLTIARRYHSSARKKLMNPGPATSIRSTVPSPSWAPSCSARRAATSRGFSPRGAASSIAALEL